MANDPSLKRTVCEAQAGGKSYRAVAPWSSVTVELRSGPAPGWRAAADLRGC